MAHPLGFRYLSYSTTLAEHAVHRLRQCRPSAGLGHVCSRLFNEMMSDLPTGWPHDHGPTNVGAMVKNYTKGKDRQQTTNTHHRRDLKTEGLIQ